MADPEFSIDVDGMSPACWNEILGNFSDANLYQTWAYGAVRWGARRLSHLVLRKQGKVVAAAQLRIVEMPLMRAGLAYLRWGPLFVGQGGESEPAVLNRMAEALKKEYVDRRGFALQIIPQVFCNTSRAELFTKAFSAASFEPERGGASAYRTFLVDISPDLVQIRKQLDQKWRNQLNRAEKNDLHLSTCSETDKFRTFIDLYQHMQKQKGFASTIDVNQFGEMQIILSGSQQMNVLIAEKNGEPVAGLVMSLLGKTGIYLLGASNEYGRESKASYWLQWQMILLLKSKNANWYDLGGIDLAANPGVYHFKKGFNGVECEHLVPYNNSSQYLSTLLLTMADRLRRFRQVPSRPICSTVIAK